MFCPLPPETSWDFKNIFYSWWLSHFLEGQTVLVPVDILLCNGLLNLGLKRLCLIPFIDNAPFTLEGL